MKTLIYNILISIKLIAFVIFISGCANTAHYTPTKSTPTVEEKKVEIQDSEFEKDITFTGISDLTTGDHTNLISIRSWLNKDTADIQHQLNIDNVYHLEQ